MKDITSSGFEFEISEENIDDWDLIKVLREIDKGNTQYVVDALPLLLGNKQAKKLEDHVRDKNGKVKISSIMKEFEEIMSKSQEVKN